MIHPAAARPRGVSALFVPTPVRGWGFPEQSQKDRKFTFHANFDNDRTRRQGWPQQPPKQVITLQTPESRQFQSFHLSECLFLRRAIPMGWQTDIDSNFKDETDIIIGIAVGMNKGHVVRRRELPPRPSRRRGVLSTKTKAVRSLIKEVCGYLPLNIYPQPVHRLHCLELLHMRNESLNC